MSPRLHEPVSHSTKLLQDVLTEGLTDVVRYGIVTYFTGSRSVEVVVNGKKSKDCKHLYNLNVTIE